MNHFLEVLFVILTVFVRDCGEEALGVPETKNKKPMTH